MIVIYGAASSGKSKIAEDMAAECSKENGRKRIYLATMEKESAAAKERIRHHLELRLGKGFETIEEMYDPARLLKIENIGSAVVLLECVSNLAANVMYREFGEKVPDNRDIGILAERICASIAGLNESVYKLIVVTNNVFGAGKSEDLWCDAYMRLLADINIRLQEEAEIFIEADMGLTGVLKG